jgi:hypothetical protein
VVILTLTIVNVPGSMCKPSSKDSPLCFLLFVSPLHLVCRIFLLRYIMAKAVLTSSYPFPVLPADSKCHPPALHLTLTVHGSVSSKCSKPSTQFLRLSGLKKKGVSLLDFTPSLSIINIFEQCNWGPDLNGSPSSTHHGYVLLHTQSC